MAHGADNGRVGQSEEGAGMIAVGDKVMRVPDTLTPSYDLENNRTRTAIPREGTVVYVHPAHRWYTVEFETPGGPLREGYHE